MLSTDSVFKINQWGALILAPSRGGGFYLINRAKESSRKGDHGSTAY